MSRLDSLRLRQHPPQWLSSKEPNYQRGILLISAGATGGHFERKMRRELHQSCFSSCTMLTLFTGHLQHKKKPSLIGHPISWPPTLFSWSAPSDYHLQPGLKKKTKFESSTIFVRRVGQCCRGDMVGRKISVFFLSGLPKLEQRAKKCIKLRGVCVE